MKHKQDDTPEIKAPNLAEFHRVLIACRRAVEQGNAAILVPPSIVLWLAEQAGKGDPWRQR